jgi:hypothetical protein
MAPRPASPMWVAGRLHGVCSNSRTVMARQTIRGLDTWPVAPSLLQVGAELQDPANGQAQPPFSPLGTPQCPRQRAELPRRAPPLGLRQHLLVQCLGELARHIRMQGHLTHLPRVFVNG